MKNQKNTLIGLIVTAILVIAIGLSQFFGYEAGTPDIDELNKMAIEQQETIREHCKNMPDMHGCESFNEPDFQIDHPMEHASMVTSEETFVVNMIPHHQEAVDTSRLILAKTTNPELKKLAQNIVTAQEKEIQMMQEWSTEWKYSAKPEYENMMGDGSMFVDKGLENWYLDGMIMHHQGALDMAGAVLELNPRKEIADFAHEIIQKQSEEITQMKLMLGENMMPLSHED